MDWLNIISINGLVSTVIYSLVGVVLFMICYFLIEKLTPFSVRKEIEEDQNIALGIIIGSMMIGLAIIIGCVIMSPADPERSANNQKHAEISTEGSINVGK